VVVATESEASFGFQSDAVSPHILVSSSSPLTLKNVSNKKWSTARANVRLSSGVHRWDVHIDRCVSKNIFLGVATREARLDNYVGCDSFGWGFLANQAVWHGKAKLRNYGELYRTGDTVSVVLDLEAGTLSYCLNGVPLGVAVEGLVGPLYPAFSLYNEADQLTILTVRSVSENPSAFGTFSAENLLDRLETLRGLLSYLAASHRQTAAFYRLDTSPASSALVGPAETADDQEEPPGGDQEGDEEEGEEDEEEESWEDQAASPTPSEAHRGKLRAELRQVQRQFSQLAQDGPDHSPGPADPEADKQPAPAPSGRKNGRSPQKKPPAPSPATGQGQGQGQSLQSQYNSRFVLLSDEVLQELLLRHQCWQAGVAVRTVLSGHHLVTLQLSAELVRQFTGGRCSLHDFLLIERRLARVLGVGGCKLWLRVEADGELISLTQEVLAAMLDKKLVELVARHDQLLSASASTAALLDSLQPAPALFDGACPEYNRLPAISRTPYVVAGPATGPGGNGLGSRRASFTAQPAACAAMKALEPRRLLQLAAERKPLTSADLKALLLQSLGQWTAERDQLLLLLLRLFQGRFLKADLFELSFLELYSYLLLFSEHLLAHYRDPAANPTSPGNNPSNPSWLDGAEAEAIEAHYGQLLGLFSAHSVEALLVRVLVLQTANDLVGPLAPLLLPFSQQNGLGPLEDAFSAFFYGPGLTSGLTPEAAPNHPAAWLKSFRPLLFPAVKEQIAVALTFEAARKGRELTRSFHQFFSALTYASLLAPAQAQAQAQAQALVGETDGQDAHKAETGRRTSRFQAVERLRLQAAGGLAAKTIGPLGSPSLSVLSAASPGRDLFAMHNGQPAAAQDSRQSPATFQSATLPPSFLQRGDTGRSLGSVFSLGGPGDGNSAQPNPAASLAPADEAADPSPPGEHPLLQRPLMEDGQFVLYLEDSAAFGQLLRQIGHERGVLGPCSLAAGSRSWRLAEWLQLSLVGQLVKFLELLQRKFGQEALTNATGSFKHLAAVFALSAGPGPAGSATAAGKKETAATASRERRDVSLWEAVFRFHHGQLPALYQSAALSQRPRYLTTSAASSAASQHRRPLPLVVRPMPRPHSLQAALGRTHDLAEAGPGQGGRPERLFVCLALQAAHPALVSDLTAFRVFAQEAVDQVQDLLGLYGLDDTDRPLQEIERGLLAALTLAEVSLLLQLVHATGKTPNPSPN
jgi:hypothetical protein